VDSRIRLVVFDWAGTTVDHGCFAPVVPFVEVLRRHGVDVSTADARGPMGLDKKEHLHALLTLPHAAAQWRRVHGRDANAADIDGMFEEMAPLAVQSVRKHSDLIDGFVDVAKELRRRGIAIGSTTGYFTAAADACRERAAAQGFAPDAAFCASDVPRARPAPWMVLRNLEATGVYPAWAVLKVGDTVPDIQEGRNAGCWSAGVSATGNDPGLTAAELAALEPGERVRRIAAAAEPLRAAGAHAVVESVRDVPTLVDDLDARLRGGERP
jgi:phosphonoacetaldehyde hydrolase